MMSEREQVELLTGPRALQFLTTALSREGSRLIEWQVDSLHHRPAAGVSVGYDLMVADLNGAISKRHMCATTSRLSRDVPGLVHLDVDELAVHLWQYPHDPELPLLPAACDPVSMSALLGESVTPTLVTYRPTRRCVLRMDGTSGAVAYVKVVRPGLARDLVARHEMLTNAGVPTPAVHSSDPGGLLVLGVAAGLPLASYLAAGLPDPAATFRAVHAALVSLPTAMMEFTPHPAWAERVRFYAHAAAIALPERAREAEEIAGRVEELMATSEPGPLATTHGDFYEANLFMSTPDSVSAILDVDSAGPGYRVDDVACLLGHVSVLPYLAPSTYPAVPGILQAWWDDACELYDRRALGARAAAVTLSLVAGAKKPQGEWREDGLSRFAEAQAWLARASD